MTNQTSILSPLSYPAATFAKLTPAPYLLAHLQPSDQTLPSTRPSGRKPLETRKPLIHTGSLSHCNGSAVVRLGDTAVVCGVRAEILLTSDIPNHNQRTSATTPTSSSTALELESLGLLVPNIELSTGSSPSNLPGNPPSTIAQSLTHRLQSILHSSNIIRLSDLAISSSPSTTSSHQDDLTEEVEVEVKGYWTLYIDTLIISHDGSLFSTIWLAVLSALRDLKLPKAEWNEDEERIECSPLLEHSRKLNISKSLDNRDEVPIALSYRVFDTESKIREEEGKAWILADTDAFEESVCKEEIGIVISRDRIVKMEKNAGTVVDEKEMKILVKEAIQTAKEWEEILLKST